MRNIAKNIAPLIGVTRLCTFFLLIATNVLLAQTQPSFAAHKEFRAVPLSTPGGTPGVFAQGDLNGDGIADLVIPDGSLVLPTQQIVVMLGNPDGTFQAPVSFNVGPTVGVTQAAVIADFNGDGKNDVAVTSLHGIFILLGDGKGGLGAAQSVSTGSLAGALVAGDFNGDKKVDLAVAGSTNVSLLLGNGDGTFQAPINSPAGGGPTQLAAGDFNNDGHLDLAVTNFSQNTVAILLGTGNGSFAAPLLIPVALNPTGIAVTDMNRDGKADVVVTNSGTDQVSVVLGKGDGTFQSPVTFTLLSGPENNNGYRPSYVAVDDFNGDGNPDVVVSNRIASTATILLGDGKGNLGKPTNLLVGATPLAVVTGDYNHDGHRDFITSNNAPGTVSLYFGKGNGTFQVEPSIAAPTRADQIVVGDFNEDGVPDFVTANAGLSSSNGNSVSVVLGKKGGKFGTETTIMTGPVPESVAIGDLNHDGHLDLVVANEGVAPLFQNASLSVMLGNGNGTFQAPKNIKVVDIFARSPSFVTLGDFNGDGNLDAVVCANNDQGGALLMLGDGKGGFGKPTIIPLNSGCLQALAGDFNRDGKLDLVIRLQRNPDSPITFVLLGNGDGTFSTPKAVSVGDDFGVAIGDLNNDGILDLVLVEPFVVETLLGDGHGNFTSQGFFSSPGPSLFHPGLLPTLGDFNGDGFLDVAVADEFGQVMYILPGNGNGTLGISLPFAGGGDQSSAAAALDFNGDGRPDLILSGFDNRTSKGILTLLLNNTK